VLSALSIVVRVVTDLAGWVALAFQSRQSLHAEVLFLRRQLALYVERGVKPRRIDPVTRISLTILSRFFNWRDALVVVRPETMIRRHRAGWKLDPPAAKAPACYGRNDRAGSRAHRAHHRCSLLHCGSLKSNSPPGWARPARHETASFFI
jgi:hypothetical protein